MSVPKVLFVIAAGVSLAGCWAYASNDPYEISAWCARSEGLLRNNQIEPDQKANLAEMMRRYNCPTAPPRVVPKHFLYPG